MAAPPPRTALPADDDAIDVTFDSLSAEEIEVIELFAEVPGDAGTPSDTADVDADELGVRAVRALEHLACEMRLSAGEQEPDRTGLPEHLALAVGRALSGRLAARERAVLDRVLAADPDLAARTAELELLWPRLRAWLGSPVATGADGAVGDEETPHSRPWKRGLGVVLFAAIVVLLVAIGVSMLVRFKPIFALFQQRVEFGAVPYVGAGTRTAVAAGESGETEIVARSFLLSVDCPSDTHVLLAAFPVRGSAWRAFPRSLSDALLPAGHHALPDGESEIAFELPFDCGPTTFVAAYRDEPLSEGDLHEIDALVSKGSEGTLRTFLGEHGFRTEVLTVVEPDR